MPFATEHASRLIDPKELGNRAGFESVRRTHGSGKGKVQGVSIPHSIDVLWYVYKDGSVIAQTLRFPITDWTSVEALKWLKDNKIKYLSFEKATNGKSLEQNLTKNFSCEIKDIDEKQGIVSIYVNAFGNLDSDRDVSEPGSFNKTIKENFKRIAHLQNHDGKIRLGWPKEFLPDNYGLLTISAMNMEKQIVKDQFSDYLFAIKMGRSLEHSIGYSVVKFSVENPDDYSKRIRRIQEYKLYEYSTLSFLGANERSTTVEAKNISSLNSEVDLLSEMLSKGDYSDEKFKQIEIKLSVIQNKITEMKTLGIEEPEQSTPIIVEPDSLFQSQKKINYSQIINQIKLT